MPGNTSFDLKMQRLTCSDSISHSGILGLKGPLPADPVVSTIRRQSFRNWARIVVLSVSHFNFSNSRRFPTLTPFTFDLQHITVVQAAFVHEVVPVELRVSRVAQSPGFDSNQFDLPPPPLRVQGHSSFARQGH